MQKPENAENQRVSDCHQRVGATEHDSIDKLLQENHLAGARSLYLLATNFPSRTMRKFGNLRASPLESIVLGPAIGVSTSLILAQQSRILTLSSWVAPVTPVVTMQWRIRNSASYIRAEELPGSRLNFCWYSLTNSTTKGLGLSRLNSAAVITPSEASPAVSMNLWSSDSSTPARTGCFMPCLRSSRVMCPASVKRAVITTPSGSSAFARVT